MHYVRAGALGAAATAAVVALTGCGATITDVSEQQADGVGSVTAHLSLCAPSPGCKEKGAAAPTLPDPSMLTAKRLSRATRASDNVQPGTQYLVAYRVPNAYGAATSVTSPNHPDVTFARSSSYETSLERQSPSGDAQKWVGYLSSLSPIDMQSGPSVTSIDVNAVFDVPIDAPAFSYRPVAGERGAARGLENLPTGLGTPPSVSPDRPVDCGDATTKPGAVNAADYTLCIESPSPLVTGSDALGTNRTLAVRQLGLTAPSAPATAKAGRATSVPFSMVTKGSGFAGTFALSGSTTVPGGTVTGGSLQLAAPSTTNTTVKVQVPKGTKPGRYQLTATATQGGQRRSVTRTLVVPAPTQASSTKTVTGTFGGELNSDGSAPLTVTCPAGGATCSGTVTLDSLGPAGASSAAATRRTLRLGSAHYRVKAGKKKAVRVKVNRRGRKALKKAGALRVKATFKSKGKKVSSKTYTLRKHHTGKRH